ncbi:hypothetical protein BBP40_010903 [Aspergillus hancockii]|nr:hypothetical protein BBP40_010903 [Aspergillus hancockii]
MGSVPDTTDTSSNAASSVQASSDVSDDNPIFKEEVIRYHMNLLKSGHDGETVSDESAYAPVISTSALAHHSSLAHEENPKISQFGLLAGLSNRLQSINSSDSPSLASLEEDPRLWFNVTHPSSVFICGSQGSGKSHTLSCLLENCLISSKVGRLATPLTGVVFHYDTFVGDKMGTPCEAAFLSSHPDVKVRVLCSPTNIHVMRGGYSKFNITLEPLQLDQSNLTTKRMMDLMAVEQEEGPMPLYMHTVKRILREMRIVQQKNQTPFDYQGFKGKILDAGLTPGQLEPLKQRLDTLESFMPQTQLPQFWKKKTTRERGSSWEPEAGRLTIVDLSCPCISPETACSLFNICLGIFLEQDATIGRVVALDEAHKYMNSSSEARRFTEMLHSTVRLQRHLGARVIISTQEPTISTALLNLCSITIVHRFTSPEWLRALQKHLAAAAADPFSPNASARNTKTKSEETDTDQGCGSMFDDIVRLRVGEALLFAPSAIVKVGLREDGRVEFHRLGSDFLPIRIRARLTSDGGRSVLSA